MKDRVTGKKVLIVDDEPDVLNALADLLSMCHVTRPEARVKPEDIHQFCRQHLHNWKCPKEILLVETLPRNTMGKVLKES